MRRGITWVGADILALKEEPAPERQMDRFDLDGPMQEGGQLLFGFDFEDLLLKRGGDPIAGQSRQTKCNEDKQGFDGALNHGPLLWTASGSSQSG